MTASTEGLKPSDVLLCSFLDLPTFVLRTTAGKKVGASLEANQTRITFQFNTKRLATQASIRIEIEVETLAPFLAVAPTLRSGPRYSKLGWVLTEHSRLFKQSVSQSPEQGCPNCTSFFLPARFVQIHSLAPLYRTAPQHLLPPLVLQA